MPPLKIGLLLYPGCMPTGLFATADLLGAANLRGGGRPAFAWQWVGLQPGPVACAHGTTLQAEAALADAGCDALLVPGMWTDSPGDVQAWLERHAPLVRALRALPARTQTWSYCTGVALVAEAGRLRRQSATATWWLAPWLQARHADVQWRWESNCIVNRGQSTATGVHGYLPIVCEQVERRLSAELWRDVARLMVLPRPQPAGSVFQSLALGQTTDPWLRRLREAIEACPAAELTVDRLAEAMAVSPRTLARKVAKLLQTPVASHARLLKFNQVAEQLTHTQLPLAAIGDALGFADESSLRRSFKQLTGLTPAAYRQAYGR